MRQGDNTLFDQSCGGDHSSFDRRQKGSPSESAVLHKGEHNGSRDSKLAGGDDAALLESITWRISTARTVDRLLTEVVEFVASIARCDSCSVYVLESDELVLRASKNPHAGSVDRLELSFVQGITGWVAEHCDPVAVAGRAYEDRRLMCFNGSPENRFEAYLSVPMVGGGRLVGVINVQNRDLHHYSSREINVSATVGFMAGTKIEIVRLERENSML